MKAWKALSLVVVIGLAGAAPAAGGLKRSGASKPPSQQIEKGTTQKSMEESTPLACRIGALDAAQRERHKQLRKQMFASVKEVRELPDGYEFRLPAETEIIQTAAEFITLERLCCPFFKFALEIGEEGKPLWLRLTGREGVKEFMRIELGIK